MRSFLGARQDAYLYTTATLCPACSVGERRPHAFLPADVRFDLSLGAVQRASCARHGEQTLLLAGSPALSWRLFEQSAPALQAHEARAMYAPQGGLSHAAQRLAQLCLRSHNAMRGQHATAAGAASAWPAVHDVSVVDAQRQLVTPEALAAHLRRINPEEASKDGKRRTLLRLRAPLYAGELEALNALLKHALEATRGRRLCLELSPERHAAIARLPDAVLLSPRVYPHVRGFVKRGQELSARMEFVSAMGELASFEDISVAAELCVEKPWPNLEPLFDSLLRHKTMVRLVVVTLGRAAQQVLRASSPVRSAMFFGERREQWSRGIVVAALPNLTVYRRVISFYFSFSCIQPTQSLPLAQGLGVAQRRDFGRQPNLAPEIGGRCEQR